MPMRMMVTSKPMIPAGTLYSLQSLTEMLQERPAHCVRGADPLAEMLRRSLVGPKPLYQKRSVLVHSSPPSQTTNLRLAICSKTHTEIKVRYLATLTSFETPRDNPPPISRVGIST